jgi:pilus assembly protein CpaB
MAERRYTTIFAFAVLTAGVATFGIYRVLQAAKAKNKIQTQPVVVALQDVSEGRSIEPTSVAVAQWPAGTVPAGAFSSVDSVVGRVARIDVFKGEVIVPGRLAPNGTGPGLEVKITPGKRAMSVRIDDVAGVSNMIQPNSRVDVMVTIRDSEKNGQQVSKLFMSNMRVLSVGTISQVSSDNRPISAPTATLEVTPVEAERLAIAQGEGRIQLVLRGYGDPDSIKTEGAKSADVLSQLRAAPIVKTVAAPSTSGRRARAPEPRLEAPAPVVVQQSVPVAPPKPKVPDTLAVQIYKGDKLDTKKFAKPDTVKPPSP